MALDAGSVAAVLAARVDDSGFREFDRKIAEANRREAIADLGAKVDDGGFSEFNAKVRRAGTETGRAKLVADVDEKSFLKFEEKVKRVDKMRAEGKLELDASDFERAIAAGEAKLERLKRRRSKAVLDLDVRGIARAQTEITSVERNLDHLRHERAEIKVDVDRSAFDRFLSLMGRGGGGGAGGGGGGDGRGLLLGLGGTGGSGRLASSLAGKSLPALTVAALAAEGALSALAAAALGLGGALAPLAGALAVIPGALAGLGQAAGALFATFSGIPGALKAASEATKKSAVDDTAALGQQRVATDAVRGAKTALANTQEQAKVAQEALTQARRDATRQLVDMRNASRDAQLQERSANLALEEARARLAQVIADPTSTQLDIERAKLDLRQAQQGAREARIEAARAKADSDRAQRGGPERLPQVVSARRAVADAARAEREATQALSRAQEQATVRTSKLSASQEKLREAMAGLSPAGQRFVRFLLTLRAPLDSIKKASQEAALPHFQTGIQAAMKNLPTLRGALTETSRVFGQTAESVGRFIGSRGFGRDFQVITRTNNDVLRNLGRSLIPLGKAFNNVAVAAAPFTRWLGRAALELSKMLERSTKAGRESGGIARFLHETRTTLEQLGSIALHVTKGLAGLFGAAIPSGHDFLGLLERLSRRFDEWANSAKGQNSIKKFLEDAKGPLKDLGGALVSVLRLVKDLIAAPGSGASFSLFVKSIDLMAKGLDFLARIPGIGGVVANLALLTVIAGRYGKLGAFATALGDLSGGLRGVSQAEADAAGSGTRRLGQTIRNQLSRLGKTRVGEEIAGQIAAGLGVGAIKFRNAVDAFRGIMRRVLRRGGIAAGTSAGEAAAGSLGAEATSGGALGKLTGRFGRLGRLLGRAMAIGLIVGLGAWIVEWELRHKEQIHRAGRIAGEALLNGIIDAINAGSGLLNKPLGIFSKLPGVPDLKIPKIGHVDLRDWDNATKEVAKKQSSLQRAMEAPVGSFGHLTEVQARRRLAGESFKVHGKTFAPDMNVSGTQKAAGESGKKHRAAADKAFRDSFREGRATSITYDLSRGIGVAGTQRAFGRLQDVVRRGIEQTKRLVSRRAGDIFDPIAHIRPLTGGDPLHLGAAVLRSRDEATRSAKRIVANIVRVFQDLLALRGRDPLGLGPAVLRSRDEATRSAKRIRANIEDVFSGLRPLRGNDPLGLGPAVLRSRDEATRSAKAIRSNLASVFGSLPHVVAQPTGDMLRIVASALRSLGATGIGRVTATATRIERNARGGIVGVQRRAQGGWVNAGTQEDSVLLMQKRGNVVGNRHQQPIIEEALQQEYGWGHHRLFGRGVYASGGEVVPTLVARDEAIYDRDHHVPLIERAMRNTFGIGLGELFSRVDKPHSAFARGGEVLERFAPAVARFVSAIGRFAKGGSTRKRTGPYVYPIGPGLELGRTDQGVDFSGAGPIATIGDARFTRVSPQGSGTGWPGAKGGGTGAMIVYRLLAGPERGRHVYLAENVDPARGVRTGSRLGAGRVYARARGQYPFLEIGWSNAAGVPTGHSEGYTRSREFATKSGKRFGAFISGLAHGRLVSGGAGRAPRLETRVRGPHGAIRDLVEGAVGRVRNAANRRMRRAATTTDRAADTVMGTGQGAALMRDISRRRHWNFGDWWALDAAESGHGRNLVNPTSTARLRGQFLDMNWGKYGPGSDPRRRPSMRQQILSMAQYIAERYVNPTRAWAFHKAHNFYKRGGIVGRAVKRFANGGIVGRAIQRFAGGGSVLRKATRDDNRGRPRPTAKGQHKPGKPGKPKRQRIPTSFGISYFDSGKAAFERIYDDSTGTLGVAIENYEVDVDDAGITDESQFYIDQATNTIQWEWVDKRISEIRRLQGDIDVITGQIQQAISIAASYLDQVKLALQTLYERRRQILARARELVARIKSLTAAIKDEARKKHSDKDLLARWRKQLKGHADELDTLTGSRTEIGTGGQLGATTIQIGDESQGTGLLGLRELFSSGLEDLRGRTGRAGKLHQYAIERAGLDQELAGLAPGELSKQLTGAAGAVSPAQDITNFLVQIGDLQKTFGSNFRPLPGLARGGRVRAIAKRLAGWARGGFAGILPGYSRTDDTIIAVRGGEGVLRPEDHLPYADRMFAMTKAMGLGEFGSVGEMFRRTGASYRAGGEVAPQRPPIQLVKVLTSAESALPGIIKPLPGLATGGLVGRRATAVEVLGDGKLVRDSGTGKLEIVVKQADDEPRSLTQNNYFDAPPPDPHTFTKTTLDEMKAAV